MYSIRTKNTRTQNPKITRHSTQGNNKISHTKTKHYKNREFIWSVWILRIIVELGAKLQVIAQGNNKIPHIKTKHYKNRELILSILMEGEYVK